MHCRIRDARDDDAAGLIALIASCYSEYEGCVLDVENEAPELKAIASAHVGGRFWVVESGGEIVGSIGILPVSGNVWEIKKLYVVKGARRGGLGKRLVELAQDEARRRGATAIELWSDTRFADAHRLYTRLGYEQGQKTRELHDLSKSVEYYFRKVLGG
jgi:putative acetyltransferase